MVGQAAETQSAYRAVWLRGKWVRRHYYVEDNYIKPAANSTVIEYDPLVADSEARWSGNAQSPHQDLARLDSKDREAVAQFACKWGLLGVFTHDLERIQYVPGEDGSIRSRHKPPYQSLPQLIEDVWGACGRSLPLSPGQAGVLAAQGWEPYPGHGGRGIPYPQAMVDWLKDRSARGLVTTNGLYLNEQGAPLEKYFKLFFPALSEGDGQHLPRHPFVESRYPALHSPQIWDHLHEPVSLFSLAAVHFQTTLKHLADPDHQDWRADDARELMRQINRHMTRVRVSLEFDPSRPPGSQWFEAYRWPSLIAACYLMTFRDLTRGRAVRVCQNETCGRIFFANRGDQRSCSPTCQNQQAQRRFRRGKKVPKADGTTKEDR
jgi:hypothetical protein